MSHITRLFIAGFLFSICVGAIADYGQEKKQNSPQYEYCRKNLLRIKNGIYSCPWQLNFSNACAATFPYIDIQKEAILNGPVDVGKCDDRQVITRIYVQ